MTNSRKPSKSKRILGVVVLFGPVAVVLFLRRQYGITSDALMLMPMAIICAVAAAMASRDWIVKRTIRARKRRAKEVELMMATSAGNTAGGNDGDNDIARG